MTKADIVNEVAKATGLEKIAVQSVIESFMDNVKDSLAKNKNVYLRGFGSFIVKKRAKKTARNISKNTTLIIPAHNIPAFKPAKVFMSKVKSNVKKFGLCQAERRERDIKWLPTNAKNVFARIDIRSVSSYCLEI